MSTCTDTYKFYGEQPVTCSRTLDADGRHKGQHEVIVKCPARGERPEYMSLATWNNGGGSMSNGTGGLSVCSECDGYYLNRGLDFNPSVAPLSPGAPPSSQGQPSPGRCFHCSHWLASAETHATGWRYEGRGLQRRAVRTVRLHNDEKGWYPNGLYGWSEGVTGAFGDRKVIITFDGGEKVGPASSLWFAGRIPWEFDHLFPANAMIEWVGR